jgi:hypothetical protein
MTGLMQRNKQRAQPDAERRQGYLAGNGNGGSPEFDGAIDHQVEEWFD